MTASLTKFIRKTFIAVTLLMLLAVAPVYARDQKAPRNLLQMITPAHDDTAASTTDTAANAPADNTTAPSAASDNSTSSTPAPDTSSTTQTTPADTATKTTTDSSNTTGTDSASAPVTPTTPVAKPVKKTTPPTTTHTAATATATATNKNTKLASSTVTSVATGGIASLLYGGSNQGDLYATNKLNQSDTYKLFALALALAAAGLFLTNTEVFSSTYGEVSHAINRGARRRGVAAFEQ